MSLALLATACGGSATKRATSSATTAPALAFARCMRTHGVPSFPDPDPQGDFPAFRAGVSKATSKAADGACRHLLPTSGGTGTPQQRRQKLAFGVEVARCLRAHGYPSMPDPTGLGSQSVPAGIDMTSPRFQTTETACEQHAQRKLGLP